MSKISIKTDFKNGEKLFDTDLNNNFKVIQAGVNANEESLQEVIDEAIVRLDAELEAITADRGWDWNGGDRVTFYKGDTSAVDSREIVNGQMLYNTDTGETALDDNGERIITGSGNVVSVGETQPTNPATKLWIDPRKMVKYGASYVVDSMEGTDKDKSPSVNAVKEYIDGIIESGTGYVKYADGTMICFYTQDITTSVSNSWGSALYISNALTLNDFAQEFLTMPCVQINVTGSASSVFVVNATDSSTINPGKIHLARPQTDTSKLYKINVLAIGRWK